MRKYRVWYYTSASTCIEVVAEEAEAAIELAIEELPRFPYLRDIDFGGEWEFEEVEEVEE